MTDPAVTEALGDSVDFFWIDLEHTPIGLESLQAHLIAARAVGTPAMVRVPSSDPSWAKRVLDIGAEGIVVPQVRTVQEVQTFVDACRYAPMGKRGLGPRRPSNYGRNGGTSYREHANKTLFVSVQIETTDALDQVDQIVDIRGIDSLVVGPSDLAASLGITGQMDAPELKKAIRKISESAHRAGIHVGAGMAADVDFALNLRELGVDWVQCGCDYSYLIGCVDQLYGQIRQKIHG